MEIDSVILVFVLFSVSVYLMLKPSVVDIILGFALLSNGVNLLILFASDNPDAKVAPLIGQGVKSIVDPLPQALILTAIVIGFGLTCYLIVYSFRLFRLFETKDTELFTEEES